MSRSDQQEYAFLKGHGTENDFIVLPDPDGTVHGDLAADRVRALCDRRAGLGADGVLRVIRTEAYVAPDRDLLGETSAEWFMDYRNADGSPAEMCGNGTRVFAAYLRAEGLVAADGTLTIATRAGDRTLIPDPADPSVWTVDLGRPRLLGTTTVGVGQAVDAVSWTARHVDMGNPHAVAFLDDQADLEPGGAVGRLLEQPTYDHDVYPHGVNVEFVARVGEGHLRMRVHERGVGETRSCGTGIGATAVAAMDADGVGGPRGAATCTVDVPGGRLTVRWTEEDRVLLTGPAALVARGTTGL